MSRAWMAVLAVVYAMPAWAQRPRGPQLQVNTYTTAGQGSPAVAYGAGGSFVVVWDSYAQDGSGDGVFGQRFDASGSGIGGEFLVNEGTSGPQSQPSVAVDAEGRMVMAWDGIDGNGQGVIARRFDADGVPEGGDFQVNTFTPDYQRGARIAIAPSGRFMVVWSAAGQGGYGSGPNVFGQLFDESGAPQGGEFRVNSYTTGTQTEADVAFYAGHFIVVWSSGGPYSWHNIFAQKYDTQGLPLGGEFAVNAYTTRGQYHPAVASDQYGNFVVAWERDGAQIHGGGIFAQRFDSSATAIGPEFRVDTHEYGERRQSAIAMERGGAFVVVWTNTLQDQGGHGVFARRYDATGAPASAEFQVNSHTIGSQLRASVAARDGGEFIVAWIDTQRDGNGSGIFLQRFGPNLIFADGFESGDLSAWGGSSTDAGDLSASPAAALVPGSAGLQGIVDDTAGLYAEDDTPDDDSRYRARFYFDPNGFDPGEAQLHRRTRLFVGFEESPDRRLFAVVLRRLAGAYAVMARVRLDDGSQRNTPFVPISDEPHWVELGWRRATGPDAYDGGFEFWVDGTSVFSANDVDNSISGVDFVRLGALSVKAGASGTLYWDAFHSQAVGFIGP